jgi:lysophospholipase L1-like esterase
LKKLTLFALAACLLISFKQKQLTWVAIGDSITYLNDHSNETGNRVKKGYLTRVTELLPDLKYVNKGFNGWTSGGIAQKIDELGLQKADVYTVFLGTNDWWSGRPLGTLEDYKNGDDNKTVYGSFHIIIKKIRELNPAARIVLITPMQRADFVYIADAANNAYGSYKAKNGQMLEQFANAIIAIAAYEKIPVADLYHTPQLKLDKLVKFKQLKDPATGKYVNYPFQKSVGIPFDPKADEYPYPAEAIGMTYDGLHPSDEGNAVIAQLLAKKLK